MKKKVLLVAVVASVLFGCSTDNITNLTEETAYLASATSEGPTIIPGKYIVVFKEDKALNGLGAQMKGKALGIIKKHGGEEAALEFVYSKAIQGFSATLSPGLYKKLSEDAEVAYIEQDFEVTISQKGKPGGGGTSQPPQEVPWGIARIGGAGDGTGKTAWIIDTGIDLTHPDLNVDATRGFTAFTSGRDANFNDGNGHGTHVAGTVAALNNSIGVVGVAAGAKVVPVKVLSSRGSGSNSGVIAGVDHVATYGQAGDVANMSLGGGVSTALDQAVLNASNASGVKFALAAGNESDNANNHSPARVNGSNITTVSAHDVNNNFASFSNYGNPPVDFCAPGVSIKSTWMGGGYNTISGTSMATPHVCGLLLLGPINSRGPVNGDPDGNPDPMAGR